MSRGHRRRIVREGDGIATSSASLLVEVPSAFNRTNGGGGFTEQMEDVRREGYDAGYQAALAELAAAEATGRATQLRRVADALVTSAEQVAESRHQAVQLGAVEAAELAYRLAESFLERELRGGEPVLEAVTRALRLVPEEQDLIVRLHPGDAISVDDLQEMVPDAAVKVVADPKVEAGGCVVVAGPCRVDTQLASALARARQVLEELYPGAADVDVPEAVA